MQVELDLDLQSPAEHWERKLRQVWATWENEKRGEVEHRIRKALNTPAIGEHELFANAFRELLGDISLVILNPSDWVARANVLAAEATSGTNTLFLFDLDLSKCAGFDVEGGYKQAIRLIQGSNGNLIYCGVVSSRFDPGEERQFSRTVTQGSQHERIVFLSKQTLHTSPIEFASGLKRVWLAEPVAKLRARISADIDAAHRAAVAAVNAVDIFEFVYAVVQKSQEEGIWELDTYRRIYNSEFAAALRKIEREDAVLRTIVGDLRISSQIAPQVFLGPGQDLLRLEARERFESSESLAAYKLPLALGDVFELTSNLGKANWMLLAHPCDLAVRSDTGRRSLTHGLLAQVIIAEPDKNSRDSTYELKYYTLQDGTVGSVWVNFKQYISIPLLILDLSTQSDDGTATWQLEAVRPDLWRPSGAKHMAEIEKSVLALTLAFPFRRGMTNVSESGEQDPTPQVVIQATSNSSEFVLGFYDNTGMSLSFGCKRACQLKEPFASAVLTRFGQYLSRATFDVELGK